MTMLAQIGQDTGLLALLLEALKGPLKILVLVDDDFGQTRSLPGGSRSLFSHEAARTQRQETRLARSLTAGGAEGFARPK